MDQTDYYRIQLKYMRLEWILEKKKKMLVQHKPLEARAFWSLSKPIPAGVRGITTLLASFWSWGCCPLASCKIDNYKTAAWMKPYTKAQKHTGLDITTNTKTLLASEIPGIVSQPQQKEVIWVSSGHTLAMCDSGCSKLTTNLPNLNSQCTRRDCTWWVTVKFCKIKSNTS